jgi:hypothetical protein
VKALQKEHRLIFCSGRPERMRHATAEWLQEHLGLTAQALYMRGDDDRRADDIVKRELLARMREDRFNPELAIDDRRRVVDMWRSEGLVCAQVAEGDF